MSIMYMMVMVMIVYDRSVSRERFLDSAIVHCAGNVVGG
jgi:hypothetical protein